MMREFRGKRIDNGEWVEGRLIADDVIVPKGQPFEIDEGYLCCDGVVCYEVIPESVGQYTGLTDKSGKRIFEGDIVVQPVRETSKHSPCIVEFHKGKFQAHYVSENRFFDRYYDINSYTKVIGNIHDNSELLKGGADE